MIIAVRLTHAARDVDDDRFVVLEEAVECDRGVSGRDPEDGAQVFIPWTSVAMLTR